MIKFVNDNDRNHNEYFFWYKQKKGEKSLLIFPGHYLPGKAWFKVK
jgi:hypothetical protein